MTTVPPPPSSHALTFLPNTLASQFETKARATSYPGMAVTLPTTSGSFVIEVEGNVLSGTMITASGTVGDQFSIRKGRAEVGG